MGLMDNIGSVGKLAGQLSGGSSHNNRLIGALAKVISSSNIGGLSGLTQMLVQRGHADTVNSWISSERNRAISPQDVQDVLGQDRIREVANDAGVSEQEAKQGISNVLPQLVDQMTPGGKLPEGDGTNNTLARLANHFLGGQSQ